jgi:hypothetical protein
MTEFCFYCECTLTNEGDCRRTKDHIIPKSKGGRGNRGYNVVIACDKCNRLKDNYTLEYFAGFIFLHGNTNGYTNQQIQRVMANIKFLIETRINVFKEDMIKKKAKPGGKTPG